MLSEQGAKVIYRFARTCYEEEELSDMYHGTYPPRNLDETLAEDLIFGIERTFPIDELHGLVSLLPQIWINSGYSLSVLDLASINLLTALAKHHAYLLEVEDTPPHGRLLASY